MRVELREITAETVRAICRLEVLDEQRAYVAPVAVSIAQAHFEPSAVFRAVYADDQPVGFILWRDGDLRETAYLWRFMIDKSQQRRGYGHAALRLVIDDVRRRHPALKRFLASTVPGPHTPRPFYESLGFVFTGEVDDGEEVLELLLTPTAPEA